MSSPHLVKVKHQPRLKSRATAQSSEELPPSAENGNPSIFCDDIPAAKTITDLYSDLGASLPVQRKGRHGVGRLNIDACLDLYGITDPGQLWNHDFTPGSAGYRIRAALGGVGYGPKNKKAIPPSASDDNPLSLLPRSELPKLAGKKKEDLEAGLKLFGLTMDDPSSLWDCRYLPGTAGYRLKEMLRCRGYQPPAKIDALTAPSVMPPSEAKLAESASVEQIFDTTKETSHE